MPAQRCTRHPDRETLRICGRCERPFCPDCLVDTPVGGRCRECARPARSALLVVTPWRWPLVALAALLGGLVASLVLSRLGFFSLILSYPAGFLIAGGTLAASGRRPGKALAVVTIAFIVLGSYLSTPVGLVADVLQTASAATEGASTAETTAVVGPTFVAGLEAGLLNIRAWIMAAIMAFAAYARVR